MNKRYSSFVFREIRSYKGNFERTFLSGFVQNQSPESTPNHANKKLIFANRIQTAGSYTLLLVLKFYLFIFESNPPINTM